MFSMVSASASTCRYQLTDIWTVSGTDIDGTQWSYTHYEYSYVCDDGYLGNERPCGPAGCGDGTGGTGGTGGTTPPPSNPGCSFSSCTGDCDRAYMDEAGVEVIGNQVIYHYLASGCGLACQQYAKAQWDTCKAQCIETCNLP